MTQLPLIGFVDVDDTLIRTVGTRRIPLANVIRHVKQLHLQGAVLYCWSTGGADYARDIASELGLLDCFLAFLPKPNILIDDQLIKDWRSLLEIHPFAIEEDGVDKYQAMLKQKFSRS